MPKIEYEHYGVCSIKNTAFLGGSDKRGAPLDPEYVGEFAEPCTPDGCCVVLRTTSGARGAVTPPRRCRGRRKAWNTRYPEKAWLCCESHRCRERAAREWAEGKVVSNG